MPISNAPRGSSANKVTISRYMKGKCGMCYKMIMPGEAYEYTGGSNTSNRHLVHFNCYNSVRWEELTTESQNILRQLKRKEVNNAEA